MSKGNKKNTYKAAKVEKGSARAQVSKKQYIDLYYMIDSVLSVKEIAGSLLEEKPELDEKMECWEEAGVLEIITGEESSIDMEMLELSKDEMEDEFLVTHKVVCVYSVHTDTTQLQHVKELFGILVGKRGGMLCSDTADFQPILVK